MAHLWMRLGRIYGAERWAKNYGDADDGTWARGLEGLTMDHLRRGVSACERGSKWLVNLPEFRDLCLPTLAELGIPEVGEAYRMATQRQWGAHPLVYLVVQRIGSWDWQNGDEKLIRPRYLGIYRDLAERARNGECFELPTSDAAQLAQAAPVPPTAEELAEQAAAGAEARKELQALRSRMAAGKPPPAEMAGGARAAG